MSALCKVIFVVVTFHKLLHITQFLKPAWYFNFSKLSASLANIVYFTNLCMISVPSEKISKDMQGIIERVVDRFGRDPNCLQFLFLSNADKSC